MPSSDFWRFFLSPKIQEAKQEPGYRKNNSFWEEKESHFHTPSLGPNFLSEFFYIFHFWPGSKLEVALSGKEFGFQSRRCKRGRFSHWVGKIPRRKWQLQYSCLENSMNRGAWWATAHGVAESRTRLSAHTASEWYLFTVLFLIFTMSHYYFSVTTKVRRIICLNLSRFEAEPQDSTSLKTFAGEPE